MNANQKTAAVSWLIVGLGAVLATALVALPTHAQEVQCGPVDQVVEGLAKGWGEHVRGTGIVDPSHQLMMLFVNDVTGTWTLIGLQPNGVACIGASGTNWEPQDPPIPGEAG
jgi:hypothetical protein